MASKYDPYWQEQLDTITTLVKQAVADGQSEPLDVSGIATLGDRESWYGNVRIVNGQVVGAKNAHMVALGRLIAERLPEGTDASISVNPVAVLTVKGAQDA